MMKFNKINPNPENKPHFLSDVSEKMSCLLTYLYHTEDTSIFKEGLELEIEAYSSNVFLIKLDGNQYYLNINNLTTLKTHHFIHSAIYLQELLEGIWFKIEKFVDLYLLDVKRIEKFSGKIDTDISFSKGSNILVKGVDTGIPFNYKNYYFVEINKQKWQ